MGRIKGLRAAGPRTGTRAESVVRHYDATMRRRKYATIAQLAEAAECPPAAAASALRKWRGPNPMHKLAEEAR